MIDLTNTLMESLGIEITEISDEKVLGKMPVDHRTIQPAGILHGGASVAFAESLASIGANALVNYPRQQVVGMEINANHIRPATDGWVYGEAVPVHIGGKTQVWEIHIKNEEQALICISRMTLAVIRKR